MSVKKFGARDINLTSSSGTPNITSPNILEINAQSVAISTDLSIGGDITSDIQVVGVATFQDDVVLTSGNLNVTGGALFTGDVQSTSTGFSFLAGIGTNTATDDFSYLSDGEIVVNRLSNSTAFQASSSGTLGVTIDSDGEANFSINNAGGVVNVGPYQNSNNTFGGVSLFSVGAVKANRPSGQEDGNVWLGTLNGGITSRIYAGGDAHFNGNVGIATNVVDSSVALKVQGDAIVTGIVSASRFIGDSDYNIFMGTDAGGSYDASTGTACYNVAIGYDAGPSLTTGDNNIFLGRYAGHNNCSGANNIFMGCGAGFDNTCGNHNFFGGYQAGRQSTRATCGIHIGYHAGYYSCGDSNIFLGKCSGFNTRGNGSSCGNGNIFLGSCTGQANQTGKYNIFIGDQSGKCNTDSCNIAIGYLAGCLNTGGSNIIIGRQAGRNKQGGNNNIFLGDAAGNNVTFGANNILIGAGVNPPSLSGGNQLAIGAPTGNWINGDSSYNVGIGTSVPTAKLDVVGDVSATGTFTGNTLASTVGTGTAPFTVNSATKVTNLNADLLDDQDGSYYLNTSTSFGGDVSGTYNTIAVTNDSHTHQFDNLTNKTSGTGNYTTTGTFTGNTLASTVGTGTAPISVASSTLVLNLNADLLDGQEGSHYLDYNNFTNTPSTISELSDDTTPQLGGDLDTNEFNIKFGDSIGINTNRAQFGIGTDLQIYHDGIDSWIEESGTGNLYIKSDGGAINLRLNNIDQLKVNENAATEINYGNSKKFETTTDGVKITGLTTTQSLDVTSNAIFNGKVGINTTSVGSGTTDALLVGGHVIPSFHNTYDIGSNAVRWRNIYTTDLKLSNEGKVNDVDGTWGNYTIQEGEDDLYLINHRNGKKYKFVIQEVN